MEPFGKYDLSATIKDRKEKIISYINSLSDDDIMSDQDEKICNNMLEKHGFHLVVIGDEVVENRTINQTKIKKYNSFYRNGGSSWGEPEYYSIDGIEVSLSFPYSGDSFLFESRSNTFSYSYPDISLFKGHFILSASETLENMEKCNDKNMLINKIYNNLSTIKKFISYGNNMANSFNTSIVGVAKSAIEKRKAKISKFYNISQMLEIPITRSEPKVIEEIKIERKIEPLIKREKNKTPQYSINDEIYFDILKMIKHQCSTFERTPKVYDNFAEEDLRDVILAHLNGLFMGKANGECFRKKGKTDILIEYEDRAAFIAECKFWGGKKVLISALNQLLNYITWRDNKLSLILFSKNKDFFNVLKEIKDSLPKEENYISLKEIDKNEFDLKIRSTHSDSHILTIRVFAFDLSKK